MPNTPPIARADIVGSLLRPPVLQEAAPALNEGKITDAEMQAVEDRVVLDHIALQEASGVDIISDGEARRTNWIASLSITDSSYRAPMGGFHMRTDVKAPAWFDYWRTNQGSALPHPARRLDRARPAPDLRTRPRRRRVRLPQAAHGEAHQVHLPGAQLPPRLLEPEVLAGTSTRPSTSSWSRCVTSSAST